MMWSSITHGLLWKQDHPDSAQNDLISFFIGFVLKAKAKNDNNSNTTIFCTHLFPVQGYSWVETITVTIGDIPYCKDTVLARWFDQPKRYILPFLYRKGILYDLM